MWISFFFIIVILLALIINNYYENLQSYNNYKINFINKKNGCKILSNTSEPYLNKLNKREMITKNCIKSKQETNYDCIKNYCKSAINWSDKQKKAIYWVLDPIIIFLQQKYPKYPSKLWNIIQTDGNIESGLPHTRLTSIVVSNKNLDFLVKCYKKNHIKKALKNIGRTLIHEHFHIFQKTHQKFFHNLYEFLWDFRKADNINNLSIYFSENQRLNPDTIDKKWVFYNKYNKKYQYPISLLKNEKNPKLYNPDKLLLYVDKNDESNYSYTNNKIMIDKDLTYSNKFCKIDQIYHPNEISAVFWTQNILDEMNIKKLPTNRKICTNEFQEYMKSYLSYTVFDRK